MGLIRTSPRSREAYYSILEKDKPPRNLYKIMGRARGVIHGVVHYERVKNITRTYIHTQHREGNPLPTYIKNNIDMLIAFEEKNKEMTFSEPVSGWGDVTSGKTK